MLFRSFVIDNRAGATGNIGADLVAKAPADGYTILLTVSSMVTSPFLEKVPFDVTRDFAGVTQLIRGSYVLVAGPRLKVSSLGEFLEAARRAPGRLNYGSFGGGSGPHLAMELLRNRSGIDVTHVPYKGLGPMQQALLAGEVDVIFAPTVGATPQVRAGKMQALAVSGPNPVAALPGVPTIASSFAGYDSDGWQGIWVPTGTPRPIISRLQQEISRALNGAEVSARLRDLGFEPVGNSPEEFDAYFRSELAKWSKLIRDNQIQAN